MYCTYLGTLLTFIIKRNKSISTLKLAKTSVIFEVTGDYDLQFEKRKIRGRQI